MRETKFCQHCGAEIDAEAEICPKCGVRVKKVPIYSEKSPGLAVLLSFLIIGLGQIYNGDVGKGVVLLIVGVILAATIIGLIVAIPLWIYSMYDAYKTAERINAEIRA